MIPESWSVDLSSLSSPIFFLRKGGVWGSLRNQLAGWYSARGGGEAGCVELPLSCPELGV
jgi:hypothetical protein